MPKRKHPPHEKHPPIVLVIILIVGAFIGASIAVVYTAAPRPFSSVGREPVQLPEGTASAEATIVAITDDGGEGILGKAVVELRSGTGRVLISANPFIEPDTQDSIKTAKAAVEKVLGASLERSDVIASFILGPDGVEPNATQIVGGPSAGSALAVAMIAAIQGKTVRSDVAFTGTVKADGSIGPVGGILEKAQAAGEAGIKIFIVPAGQGNLSFYEREVVRETRNGFVVQRVRYVPKIISLDEYTEQWNMTSFEAATVLDAARIAILGFQLPSATAQIGATGAATSYAGNAYKPFKCPIRS